MFDNDTNMENIIIEKISLQEQVKQFEPEVQDILYKHFGENLEEMPVND